MVNRVKSFYEESPLPPADKVDIDALFDALTSGNDFGGDVPVLVGAGGGDNGRWPGSRDGGNDRYNLGIDDDAIAESLHLQYTPENVALDINGIRESARENYENCFQTDFDKLLEQDERLVEAQKQRERAQQEVTPDMEGSSPGAWVARGDQMYSTPPTVYLPGQPIPKKSVWE